VSDVQTGAQPDLKLPFRVVFANGNARDLETIDVATLVDGKHGYLREVYVPVPGRTQIIVPGNQQWWSMFAYDVVSEANLWKYVTGPLLGSIFGVIGTLVALGLVP
jgi:hypothetical protein